ncbi:outer membrane beta-barrel protein, partial [Bacteroides cellulosilyticus]
MKKYSIIIALLLIVIGGNPAKAQQDRTQSIIHSSLHGWEYALKAGFSIGGTAPLPLPEEIRKIDSYVPSMAISIEGNATKWLDEKKIWGLTLGLRLETKNMTTEATVKNYGMKIINTTGGELEGLWTGGVKTK